MREGTERQERETAGRRPASPSGAPLARWCVGVVICWLAFGDYPSQADDFQHELAAARLVEASVLAKHRGRGDLQHVGRIYLRLVTRYPKNPEAHSAYAVYLWEANDGPGALAQWQTAESLDPRNAGTANRLGGCYLAKGDSRKALVYFARAASLEPRNAGYQFDLANATFIFRHDLSARGGAAEQAILEDALDGFKKAAELDPFNAEYARAYAETFYGLKQPEWRDALKAWKHFLELKGPPDFCYANLARVNLKLGRKEDALENLDKVTRSDFRPVKAHLLQEARGR